MIDDKRRAMMAADLYERAARMVRSLGTASAKEVVGLAWYIDESSRPVEDYREALRVAGLASEAIDAAVASIRDGKHPDDSLAGQVLGLAQHAARAEESWASDDDMEISNRYAGTVRAFRDVLALLGVKP